MQTIWFDSPLRGNLEKLAQFAVVAETGSILQASQKLRIAQSALSKSMKALEEELSTVLLRRGRNGVELTPAGARLLDGALPALHTLCDVARSVSQSPRSESVNIATHEILVPLVTSALLRDQTVKDPGFVETLRTTNSTASLLEILRNYESDICFAAEPKPSDSILSTAIFSLDYTLFCSELFYSEHFAAPRKRLRLEVIDPSLLIYADKVQASKELSIGEVMSEWGLSRTSRLHVGSLESVAALVAQGCGVGVLPRQLVPYFHGGEGMREVFGGKQKLTLSTLSIYACWRAADDGHPQIQAAIRALSGKVSRPS